MNYNKQIWIEPWDFSIINYVVPQNTVIFENPPINIRVLNQPPFYKASLEENYKESKVFNKITLEAYK